MDPVDGSAALSPWPLEEPDWSVASAGRCRETVRRNAAAIEAAMWVSGERAGDAERGGGKKRLLHILKLEFCD